VSAERIERLKELLRVRENQPGYKASVEKIKKELKGLTDESA